jgi:DNA replication protein DnaC
LFGTLSQLPLIQQIIYCGERAFLRGLRHYDVLIIDEIGCIPLDQHAANLFFQVITQRYETGSLIVIRIARSVGRARSSLEIQLLEPQ